jgi:hypothetical protein
VTASYPGWLTRRVCSPAGRSSRKAPSASTRVLAALPATEITAPASGRPAASRTAPETEKASSGWAAGANHNNTKTSQERGVPRPGMRLLMEAPPLRPLRAGRSKRILGGVFLSLPYAGINRIRFEGVFSGRNGHP